MNDSEMNTSELFSGKGEYTSPSCHLIHIRIENSVLSGPGTVTAGSIDDLEGNEYDDSIWR